MKKKYKEPRIKLIKKVIKSALSPITVHLEGEDHKPVDFKLKNDKFYLSTN